MADTMQLPTAASTDVPLRDQTCRSARATRRRSAMKPVASNTFARLTTGLTLAFVMSAGIAAVACSAAADETLTASRQTSAVAAPSSPVAAWHQTMPIHRTAPDPATTYVEDLYKQLMRSTRP